MSKKKPASASPGNLPPPTDAVEETLLPLTPEPIEIKPIAGQPKEAEAQDDGDSSGKRKKKVHAPDHRNRRLLTTPDLPDEPEIGELPELPVLPTELAPGEEEEELVLDAAELYPPEENETTPTPEEPSVENLSPKEAPEPPEANRAQIDGTPSDRPRANTEDTDRTKTTKTAPESPRTTPPKWSVDSGERKWLLVLVAGLLVIAVAFAILLRPGLPVDTIHQAQAKPDLPIKGKMIVISALEMDWRDDGSDALSGDLKSSSIFPRVALRFDPGSTGAIRIFFKDEREQIIGDTVDFELTGSGQDRVVTCTAGIRSRLEYDALRARNTARWTLEIHEGSNPRAPLSEFSLLCRLSIPWNLARKPSP